jgi:hypothetical protein
MVGLAMLSAIVSLGGAGIGILAYKMGRLDQKTQQLDGGVKMIASATEGAFESLQDRTHERLNGMAYALARHISPDLYDDDDDDLLGGVS